MDHSTHHHSGTAHDPSGTAHDHAAQAHGATWATAVKAVKAVKATLHCLTGCAIGEILGMAIGTSLLWGNVPTMALAITLAFVFG